jgi:hypothetical protein
MREVKASSSSRPSSKLLQLLLQPAALASRSCLVRQGLARTGF